MRIVITGAGGFIGSHLAERFLGEGHEVIGIDNFLTGNRANLATASADSSFRLVEQDITEEIKIDGPVDRIYHFASPASPRDYHQFPIQTLKVGALGTHKVMGLAKAKRARVLLASTSEVYGDPLVNPQREDYWGNVNPIGPRGVYDEAKRFAEAMVMAYQRVHKVETRIVRIFNTYGPRLRIDDGRAIPTFVSQILRGEPLTIYGDGLQTRSFCFVADMVEGISRLMEHDARGTIVGPVNIGNPEEVTLLEMARTLQEIAGSGVPVAFEPLPIDDPKVRCPDITKAQNLLGWNPTVKLREGLTRTLAWCREHYK